MNRINNFFAVIVRVLSTVLSAVKWLADDNNRKLIDRTFDVATNVAVRLVRMYRDNAESIVLAAKAVDRAITSTESVRNELAEALQEVGKKVVKDAQEYERDLKVVKDAQEYERDLNEVTKPSTREKKIAALVRARAAKAAKRSQVHQ